MKPAIEIQKHPLAADSAGEPAAQRRHDRGGDDVRGQHPRHLILGRRERALNARQRDVGDRVVERLHDRRQHDRDRDERAARSIDLDVAGGAASLTGMARPSGAARVSRAIARVRVDGHIGAQSRLQQKPGIEVDKLQAHRHALHDSSPNCRSRSPAAAAKTASRCSDSRS